MKNKQFAEHGDIVVFEDGVRARVVESEHFENNLDLLEIDNDDAMTTSFSPEKLKVGTYNYHREMSRSKIVQIIHQGWLKPDDYEYTIDELEEGVEYEYVDNVYEVIVSGSNGRYKMENSILLYKSDRIPHWKTSKISYNLVVQMKFTKVQKPKHYTFDEAKADCIENGTEYVSRWDGEDKKDT